MLKDAFKRTLSQTMFELLSFKR